ncbi:MAG: D-glyceraldehyde dehydrogenase [Candidatus Thermoplasmatota archaeon]|nr:D-glyceraldehyde dehydrogenase [Candidatus Thermoplasmatota archaeon]
MKLLIDGDWVDSSSGKTQQKFNPTTGEKLEEFPLATKDDVSRAIDAADSSYEKWNDIGSKERAKILKKALDMIQASRKELEEILIRENGKIAKEAAGEVDGVIDQLTYYIGFERKFSGDVLEGPGRMQKLFLHKVPHGVVVALTPWNFPAGMVARKLGPALLTGNSVVLKPSSDTPLSAEWIVRKFVDAGVPKGVLNFVTGKGSEIGDFIVSHKKVSLVTLTGSTETGQRIMKNASNNMAKLMLELGGKAPYIVWKDADLKAALKTLLWAKFWNTGQSCIAAERLYVHSDVYGKFMDMFKDAASRIRVGDPMTADMGPLINKSALENMKNIVESAMSDGAKVLYGGKQPSLQGKLSGGYFFEPTILEGADQKSSIFQNEIFGPVLGAMPVDDIDETFRLANDSIYGLASYLFTNDNRIIMEGFDRIRFGELYVNMPGPEASNGYHTGFRMTGQAGENSRHGVEEYLKIKNIYIDYSGKVPEIDTIRNDILP